MTSAHQNSNGNGSGLPLVPSIPLSDDVAVTANGNQSIGALVKDASAHLSTLVRAEVELAKAEVTGELKKGVLGSVFFIAAGVIALYSSFFFFFFLADLLDIWLPRWAASGIVFATMLLVAGVAVFLGIRRIRKIKAPQRTISSLKDTAAALTNRSDAPTP